ncbi:mycothiol-dependent nitroreductase Rv2466c family protein [Mycobacterium shimoidei]|uniref:DSBA-like thioredoxin domain-containing protein n=1 Tax=Mycobacterium shimoidei TaxID=29313 RepID=A0A1E3TCM4_MYCSH|nr:disulfide bond formation protein DsbA [Mycobacterium shimoidei]MCV7259594.1 disulfide bond formation protein DsbA [Mycobacterium shimoidei]ODR12172.1 disulfide bond formation protein DsbA [Mycobacterium shimoidei]ORW77994.1 disulfide bond formation protein DsbA [Mycobacterium shimoidei]SRX93096.1 hypothetical protein [Gordonia sp. KTR9] [Mycobacterium shimoidei]
MTNVELYVDPVCPFAWVTSRWLQAADRGSGLRQMSLAVLNEGRDVDPAHRTKIDWSRRLGRVFAAATADGGPDAFRELYEAFGGLVHDAAQELADTALKESLSASNLNPALVETLDDPGWDDAVRATHRRSQDALGGSGGSPIIVVDGKGFFGPVLTRIPNRDDGAELLNAVLSAASTPGFAVLQRPYQGPPSTTREENNG